jgi:hypothetical protein
MGNKGTNPREVVVERGAQSRVGRGRQGIRSTGGETNWRKEATATEVIRRHLEGVFVKQKCHMSFTELFCTNLHRHYNLLYYQTTSYNLLY